MKKIGHHTSNWWYNKGKEKDQDNGGDEAKIVQDDSNDGTTVFMAKMSEDQHKAGSWSLDTSCLNHMTGHKNWLVKLDRTRKIKVRLEDSKTL